ncbi:MAG: class I SAM-dependent methyltransferase [Nevskiales bacterium]|nr:class I SAM-dependent methyltransferase [Nevskiales bacterium]
MTTTNTVTTWARVWQDASIHLKERLFSMEQIERGLTWSTIRTWLGTVDLGSLKTIEIGAGAGTVSAVFARHGAQVTVLDYTKEALEVSADLFRHLGLKHESALADALDLPVDLLGRYDLAMSFGLAEHFENGNRTKIIKAHFDLVKPGGLVAITVPNSHCYPYRFWKASREWRGKWHWGLELPFSRKELSGICQALGVKDFRITGSSFIGSLNFILPFARLKRSIEKRVLKEKRFDPGRISQERESLLGPYLGMALILVARKPA